jgi:hypothetical protein
MPSSPSPSLDDLYLALAKYSSFWFVGYSCTPLSNRADFRRQKLFESSITSKSIPITKFLLSMITSLVLHLAQVKALPCCQTLHKHRLASAPGTNSRVGVAPASAHARPPAAPLPWIPKSLAFAGSAPSMATSVCFYPCRKRIRLNFRRSYYTSEFDQICPRKLRIC